MRVLAARFPDRERASSALHTLQQELDGDMRAEIAPLASGEKASTDTLLAGHFPDEQKSTVATIVAASGGEMVADVDEAWTRPRVRVGSSAELSYGQSRSADEGGQGYSH